MAFRVESNKTVKEAVDNLEKFLTSPISFDEPDYSQSQGNGNIEGISFTYANAVTETWQIMYDGTNNVFKITGSVSGAQANATIDTAYDNGIIAFTIRTGSTVWVDGDIVTISAVKGSSNPWRVINKGWRNTNNKAIVNGVWGYDISGYQTSSLIKNNTSDFTSFCCTSSERYGIGYEGLGYYRDGDSYSHITCNSMNCTNHKINGNVTVVLRLPLYYSGQLFTNSLNVLSIDCITSNTYTSSTTKNIHFNYQTYHLFVMDEDVYDFSNDINVTNNNFLQSIILTFDSDNGYLSIFIDGTKVVDNLQNDKWKGTTALWGRTITYPYYIDGIYIYSSILSTANIQAISDNGGHPSEDLQNYSYSIINNRGWTPYTILQDNKGGFLRIIDGTISWYPTIDRQMTDRVSWIPNSKTKMVNNWVDTYRPYGMSTAPQFHWGSIEDSSDMIDKYWYVTDGNNLLLSIKKSNTAVTPDPTYQMMYIGTGEGDTAYDIPFVIGWGGSNAFDVDNDSFRFGMMYNDNTAFWSGTAWSGNWVDDASVPSEWKNIQTATGDYSIIQIAKYKGNLNFGVPKWIQLVGGEPDPETEIYINSDKYITIPDNKNKADYDYIIHLSSE